MVRARNPVAWLANATPTKARVSRVIQSRKPPGKESRFSTASPPQAQKHGPRERGDHEAPSR